MIWLLNSSSGNLGPLRRVGVAAPGGGRFLAAAAAAAAVLEDGARVSSIPPGAVNGPLAALVSPQRWIMRWAMVFAVAPKER